MTKKKPTSMADAARKQRQRVWRHNSYLGQMCMAEANLLGIINSDSTTKMAKTQAKYTLDQIELLKNDLKVRIDP